MLCKMKVCYFLFFVIVLLECRAQDSGCMPKETEHGIVCICNEDYCDYMSNPRLYERDQVVVVSSSKKGLRFKHNDGTFNVRGTLGVHDYEQDFSELTRKIVIENETNFDSAAIIVEDGRAFVKMDNDKKKKYERTESNHVSVTVHRERKYQKILGFGGAFTGSVSHTLNQVNSKLQDHIYRSLFHDRMGIGFNMLRMPIGGSDFDLEPWAYNEEPRDDPQLSNFKKLDPRDEQKVEQIKRLKEIGGLEKLKIMAAAWSPPRWMKSNNDWSGFSHLKPEYYQAWADYHLKFIELMDAKNMSIWAISTGNEPLNGVIGWFFVRFMSLGWTPKNQAVWLSENLGPTIRNSKYNVKIFGNDDQRYTFPTWFHTMKKSRPDSLDYLDGLAVHWYWDNLFEPYLIDTTMESVPGKLLLNTESCVGDKPWQQHGPVLGSWERAEQYIRGFMQDFQHDFNGWIDWNILLNEQGGPNYVKNNVDAPIIVNTKTRREFYKQPIYYAIGHFSKFVREGSVRIRTTVNDSSVDAVGFQHPDGTVVVVISNSSPVLVDIALFDSRSGIAKIMIPPRSINTLYYV